MSDATPAPGWSQPAHGRGRWGRRRRGGHPHRDLYRGVAMDMVARGEPRRLTNSTARDATPISTRDGRSIVFETNRDGNYEIYVMDVDGSNPRNLTNAPDSREQVPSVSPDGRWVLFQSNRNGNWDIFRIPLIR